jgi:hypothetical protein
MVLKYCDRCGWDGLPASYSRTIRPMLFIYLVLRHRLPDDFKRLLCGLAEWDSANLESCDLAKMLARDTT